ncbi:MAG: NAD-dependent epimerase/dehydratase family protein [Solirubrobacteraceae bacterium]|nr:NAD-dependent epimerase/dehydratase family protein [Solirubrobacteraceae bacterium]
MLLVTGGAGFIGSHIVDALAAAGIPVRVLDHEPPRWPLPQGVEIREGDVRDPEAVIAALDGVTAVCHQAAMVGLGVDLDDIADYTSHNDLGTAVLLRAMARLGTVDRLVLASSMVVYGEGRYRCAEHGVVGPGPRARADLEAGQFEPPCPACGQALTPEAVPEGAPVDPRNVYAATKLHQEHLSAAFSRETGVPVTALRYHNVYGPRMPRDTPYAGVASLFASELAAGRPPRVFEDGGQRRDFVHVRDIARANVIALTADEAIPGAFNVCSGTPRSVLDMAQALHAASGNEHAPEITGGFRLGDVRHVFADATRAAQVLGFQAQEDFDAGMRELFAGETAGTR